MAAAAAATGSQLRAENNSRRFARSGAPFSRRYRALRGTDPRRFFIYEQYKDDAALEAHRAAPHFLQMGKKDLPKIADRTEGHLFEPLG